LQQLLKKLFSHYNSASVFNSVNAAEEPEAIVADKHASCDRIEHGKMPIRTQPVVPASSQVSGKA
jgi:hypothetical protein